MIFLAIILATGATNHWDRESKIISSIDLLASFVSAFVYLVMKL